MSQETPSFSVRSHGQSVDSTSSPADASLPNEVSLAEAFPRPMETGLFLDVAISCAEGLAAVHDTHNIHRHVNPHNLLLDRTSGKIALAGDRPAPYHEKPGGLPTATPVAQKDWPYMSPEQTGRMNRLVDYRTDLYSLGIVYYELLTGQLPFQANNLLEWVHFHIARCPLAPHRVLPSIPPGLSEVIMKLMDKAAESRYQSAHGLANDLEKCREMWLHDRQIHSFPLGESDQSKRLLLPHRLYGRDSAIRRLKRVFNRATAGRCALFMVSGYAGIGKTALVRELCEPVMSKGGFFIEGKFDPLKSSIPYSALISAFRELTRQLLAGSPSTLESWKRDLLGALKANARIITDVIPEMEAIVGQQPELPELNPEAVRNLFNMSFQSFVRVFARPEHPLVLFLDDLQYADQASLKLLTALLTDPDNSYLMVAGAYRENDHTQPDPLGKLTREVARSGAYTETLLLQPLSDSNVRQMIADMLDCSPDQCSSLADSIMISTQGNPFYVHQIMNRFYESGLLYFHPGQNGWAWDLNAIQEFGFSDNVIDLLSGRIQEMSPRTQWLLSCASSIGMGFGARLLAAISELSLQDTLDGLDEALREGLIIPARTVYESALPSQENPQIVYEFAYERFREAAYMALGPRENGQIHFRLGNTLLAGCTEDSMREHIFDIVNHLNRCRDLLEGTEKRLELAQLNLIAGQKAKTSTAYDQAVEYLEAGAGLLPDDAWESHYDTAFLLFKELSECEYLAGNHDRAEALFDQLLDQARSLMEKAEIYNMRIILYATIGQFVRNNELGLSALAMFGFQYPDINDSEGISAEFAREYELYLELMKNRSAEDLLDLPVMTDPEQQMCARICMNMLSSAYMTNPPLLALLDLKSLNMSLRQGVTPDSVYAMTIWGLLLGSRFKNYDESYQFGRLAMEFNRRMQNAPTRAKIPFAYGNFIHHWRQPLIESIEILNKALEEGLETGDFPYASYAGTAINRIQMSYGHDPLPVILEDTRRMLSFFRKINNQASLQMQELVIGTINKLTGTAPAHAGNNPENPDEETLIGRMRQINFGTGICLYYIYQTLTLYTFEFYEEALKMIQNAIKNISYIVASIQEADLVFYHALCLCTCYQQAGEEQKRFDEEIAADMVMLQKWAASCPENFQHKYALIQAEWLVIQGDILSAQDRFEEAAHSARDNGFVQGHALILERAARLYRNRGFDLIADSYMRAARAAYEKWGAAGKVRHIDNRYPWLLDELKAAVANEMGEQVGRLDTVSVVKASQAISSEIVISRLMETLMKTVIESAGAQKGVLVMLRQGQPVICAQAHLVSGGIVVSEPAHSRLSASVPETIINYVQNTRETVILDHAALESRFASDPYFDVNDARSVLCLPILRQSRLTGMLYLENNLVTGAFTSDRMTVLELLSSQAAISLENANLYEERQSMATELQDLNLKLNSIIEFLPDATFVVDHEHRVIAWNRAIEDMTGIRKEDMLGRSNEEYSRAIYGETRSLLIDLISNPGLEEAHGYSYVHRTGDLLLGEVYIPHLFNDKGAHVMSVATQLRDPGGKVIGAIESIRDISEPRQAMEERDRLRHLLNNIIDSMPSILAGTDCQGRVTQWNAEAAMQTGISKNEALGRNIAEVLPMFPTLPKNLTRALAEQAVQLEDRVLMPAGGDRRYSEIIVYPLVADQVEGAVVRVDDVTEKVRMQEMMMQTEKMMSVGGLAAGMAHEINNPLSGMLQANQNIMIRLAPDLKKNRDTAEKCGLSMDAIHAYMEARGIMDFMAGIHQSGVRAANIISNMLSFSRRSDAHKNYIHMSELIDRTLDLAANDYDLIKGYDFRHIEIIRDYSPDLGMVYCSKTEIEQVVFNLVKNSAQALAESHETEVRPQIVVRAYKDEDTAVIEVEDNGPGISSEVQRKIFEPFYTTKKTGVGTGLGLSVSYFIVTEYHRGQLLVDSHPGQGTRFTIRLPIAPPPGSLDE